MAAGRIVLATVAALMLASAGCSRAPYLNKVAEAENLANELSRMQQKYNDLNSENEAQKVRIANLVTSVASAQKERDRFAADLAKSSGQREREAAECRANDNALKTKIDSLTRANEETNRRMVELRTENSRLTQEMSSMQVAQQEKIQSVAKTYETWLTNTKAVIGREMKTEIGKGQVIVKESRGALTMNLLASVLFEPGSVEPSVGGRSILQKAVPILKGIKAKSIRVEGHTDNLPGEGRYWSNYPTNWELSAARAASVVRYLEEQGVDPRVLSVIAFGQHRPIGDNGTPLGRMSNRRIEIIIAPEA